MDPVPAGLDADRGVQCWALFETSRPAAVYRLRDWDGGSTQRGRCVSVNSVRDGVLATGSSFGYESRINVIFEVARHGEPYAKGRVCPSDQVAQDSDRRNLSLIRDEVQSNDDAAEPISGTVWMDRHWRVRGRNPVAETAERQREGPRRTEIVIKDSATTIR